MIVAMSEEDVTYHRDLRDVDRLNFRSIPEVHKALSDLVLNVGKDRKIRFRGKAKPKRAQVVNALILYLESLPTAEQRRVVSQGLDILNGLLATEVEDMESPKVAEADPGAKSVVVNPDQDVPRSITKGARKRSG